MIKNDAIQHILYYKPHLLYHSIYIYISFVTEKLNNLTA